jgi:hypothetical protein
MIALPAPPSLDSLIETVQVWAVLGCDQGRLNQRRPTEFASALADRPAAFGLIGVGDTRHAAEVAGQPTMSTLFAVIVSSAMRDSPGLAGNGPAASNASPLMFKLAKSMHGGFPEDLC